MQLPTIQSPSREFMQLQTLWQSMLNPIISIPMLQGIMLPSQALISGTTIVNHLLQRKMQGWMIIDIDAAATVYRSQPFNSLTLTLTSSAACNVLLFVF